MIKKTKTKKHKTNFRCSIALFSLNVALKNILLDEKKKWKITDDAELLENNNGFSGQ